MSRPPGTAPKAERRRYPRLEILGRVQGLARPLDVHFTLLNLSLGGFLMQTPRQHNVGETHEFQLTAHDQAPVVVRARIAHAMRVTVQRHAMYLYGMEFVDAATPAIESLISSLSDGDED